MIVPWRRVALVVAALMVLSVGWFALQVQPVFSSPGPEVVVTVHSGESIAEIAGDLRRAGVIASPFAFRLESLVLGAPLVRVGSYQFHQRSSFSAVRSILAGGPNVATLNVTGGLTLHEIALQLADAKGTAYAEKFLAAVKDSSASPFLARGSLEGLVGTGTYIVLPNETVAQLIGQMTSRFTTQAKALGLTPSTSVEGLNAYQLVVAASIVEKEGYYPRNMPKVARVIFNRLARGGPLQMDATVLYALGQDGGTVTHQMLQTQSPYNTYLNNGLTPTPICTPSSDALNAVLHAPPGPWLYFTVINKAGDEAFASTFAEQLRNEQIAASRGAP